MQTWIFILYIYINRYFIAMQGDETKNTNVHEVLSVKKHCPHDLSVNGVECFGQIHKCDHTVEVSVAD